ncbi:MAG: monofunctional biosynthetic peptidoglycan transglycosylase [Stellaceae bacterium]
MPARGKAAYGRPPSDTAPSTGTMNSRASSRRGAASAVQPRRASGSAARPKSGLLRRIGRIALYGIIGFLIGSIVLVALYRMLTPPGTPLMLIRLVEGYGIDKSWRRLDDISPHLIRAAMAGEDARFCRHHGFDWGAIETAWDRYQSGRGRLLGASTISMQTAKNVFLWPGRDWLRKGFEAWFTALIELAWGKRRIMEIYLNVAEWGPGVYGAEAASRHYFHKPAEALNPEEAVRLAAALPDPLDWSPRRPGRRLLARGAAIRANLSGVPAALPLPCGAGRS